MNNENGHAVNGEEREKVDLANIIEEIDGKYKLKVLVVCFVVNLFAGYSENEYVYTAARIQSRCMIPECENEENFEPPWIFNAMPPSVDSFERCQRYANSSVTQNVTMDSTCPQHMFDRGLVEDCSSFVYKHQNSAVYEFDLACDQLRQGLITYMTALGTILGLPVTGFFSDRYGRRMTLCFTSINFAWIGAVKYWAGSYETFVFGVFIENLLGASSFICAFILALEIVGTKHRAAVGSLTVICLTLGNTFQGLVARTQPEWRIFILIINAPQLLVIICFWVTPESVRWLISKGRLTEAKSILKRAQINGRDLPEKTLRFLEEEKRKPDYVTNKWLVSLIFHHQPMTLRCCFTPVWWISTTLFYYDLTNTVIIYGNEHWNDLAVNVVIIFGFLVGYWLMNRFGRKPVIIGGFWIYAASQIVWMFILNNERYAIYLLVYLVGKVCISSVTPVIYVFTSELYPTQYRGSLLCYSAMIGRLGVFLVPLINVLGSAWKLLPFLMFGLLALVSGVLVFLVPETRGATLPDYMEEAASLGKDKPENKFDPVGRCTVNDLEITRC